MIENNYEESIYNLNDNGSQMDRNSQIGAAGGEESLAGLLATG